ncbi:DUF2800 domain-containing protein [Paraburkholderia sp.]|uniref:DUF2800 domain-containing protein n=1 Tax=Paraburkholderia sp. TaxID=1926495 RepID=UPI002F430083
MAIQTIEHSILSFSGRDRWRACPVSVTLSKGMPDSSGAAAYEGTYAHTVAEFYIRQAFDLPGAQTGEAPDQSPPDGLKRFVGKVDGAFVTECAEWNAEMRKHGKAYVAYIQSLIPPGTECFVDIEQKVSADTIDKRLFGRLDLRLWFPAHKVLGIVDYKYGFMDVNVGTVDDPNAQLAAYAVASLDRCTIEATGGVILAVFQPRRPLGDAGHKLYLPYEWIAQERAKLAQEVAAVDAAALADPALVVQPGDHCRYCKAAPKCPRTTGVLQAALDVNAGLRSVLDMPEDDVLSLYASRTAIKALMEDIEQRVEQLAKNGSAKIEVKTSAGRRMWRNPAEATLTLLALGLDSCLSPGPLSEVLDKIPEQFREPLVGRSRESVSYKVLKANEPRAVADAFRKYVKGA